MRLVCPNCEAKYEVPDDAIPDTGRDVQCANCGHAWFQMRERGTTAAVAAAPEGVTEAAPGPTPEATPAADSEPAAVVALAEETPVADNSVMVAPVTEAPVTEAPVAEAPVVAAEPMPDVAEAVASHETPKGAEAVAEPDSAVPEAEAAEALADAAAEAASAPEIASAHETGTEAETGPETPSEPETAAQAATETEPKTATEPALADAGAQGEAAYGVDDSVLAILREEAEREAKARRAEARSLESQPDLGIDAAPPVKAAAMSSEADAKPSARRDLLPDVEEINSTLRPSEPASDADGAAEGAAGMPLPPRRSFRSGFLTVMTIAILGAAVYVAAPTLSSAIPALAGPLEYFVTFVDGFRLQLDGLMRSATVAINGG